MHIIVFKISGSIMSNQLMVNIQITLRFGEQSMPPYWFDTFFRKLSHFNQNEIVYSSYNDAHFVVSCERIFTSQCLLSTAVLIPMAYLLTGDITEFRKKIIKISS